MVSAKCTAKSVESMNILELLLPDAEHSILKVFYLIICQMVHKNTLNYEATQCKPGESQAEQQ